MTEIREILSDRLVTSKEEGTLEIDYELGQWDYDDEMPNCEDVCAEEYDYFYERYRCCEYGDFAEYYYQARRSLCNMLKNLNKCGESIDSERAIDIIEAAGFCEPGKSDEVLHEHIRRTNQPKAQESLDEEHFERAGDLWYRYVLERGAKDPDQD
jgi:hypothetical protein